MKQADKLAVTVEMPCSVEIRRSSRGTLLTRVLVHDKDEYEAAMRAAKIFKMIDGHIYGKGDE